MSEILDYGMYFDKGMELNKKTNKYVKNKEFKFVRWESSIKNIKNVMDDSIILARDNPYIEKNEFCEEVKKVVKKFSLFDSFDTLFQYINNIQKTKSEFMCFYEVIPNSFQKPHFDLDIKKDKYIEIFGDQIDFESDVNIFVSELLYCIVKVINDNRDKIKSDLELPNDLINVLHDILLYQSSDENKKSFHIVIRNFKHSNCDEAKKFYELVLIEFISHMGYSKEIGDKIWTSNFLDSAVYKPNQQFRILNSRKFDNNRYKKVVKDFNCGKNTYAHNYYYDDRRNRVDKNEELLNRMMYEESFISITHNSPFVLDLMTEEEKNKNNKFCVEYEDIDKEYKNDIMKKFNDYLILEKIAYPKSKKPFSLSKISGNRLDLKREDKCYCMCCDRWHENENAFLYVYKNEIIFKCRRSIKEKKVIGKTDCIPVKRVQAQPKQNKTSNDTQVDGELTFDMIKNYCENEDNKSRLQKYNIINKNNVIELIRDAWCYNKVNKISPDIIQSIYAKQKNLMDVIEDQIMFILNGKIKTLNQLQYIFAIYLYSRVKIWSQLDLGKTEVWKSIFWDDELKIWETFNINSVHDLFCIEWENMCEELSVIVQQDIIKKIGFNKNQFLNIISKEKCENKEDEEIEKQKEKNRKEIMNHYLPYFKLIESHKTLRYLPHTIINGMGNAIDTFKSFKDQELPDKLNASEYKFPTANKKVIEWYKDENGIYKSRCIDVKKDDYFTRFSKVEYKDDFKDDEPDVILFHKFMNEIMLNDQEKIESLLVMLSQSLLKIYNKKIFIMLGKCGRNGKSTLANAFEYIIGEFKCDGDKNIVEYKGDNQEKLNRESSAPNPTLYLFKDARAAFFCETPEHFKLNENAKKLSGTDIISCRRLQENHISQFRNCATMYFWTNNMPQVADTYSYSDRIDVRVFEAKFRYQKDILELTEEEQERYKNDLNYQIEINRKAKDENKTIRDNTVFTLDPTLEDKLKSNRFREYFLHMLVKYATFSLNNPDYVHKKDEKVNEVINENKSEDIIFEWAKDRIIVSDDKKLFVKSSDLKVDFIFWNKSKYGQNNFNISDKTFGGKMNELVKIYPIVKASKNASWGWKNIILKSVDEIQPSEYVKKSYSKMHNDGYESSE